MNPAYKLRIIVVLGTHRTVRNVSVALERYIPFVPYEGLAMAFESEDGEEKLDIVLMNLHYDYAGQTFVEVQQDDTLAEEIKNGEGPEVTVPPSRMAEYIDYYKQFGFEKV